MKMVGLRPDDSLSSQEGCLRVSLKPLRLNIDQVKISNGNHGGACYYIIYIHVSQHVVENQLGHWSAFIYARLYW